MTSEELSKFNMIESKYRLNDVKYKDFSFWNYIRAELIWKYDSLLRKYGQYHSTPTHSLKTRILLELLRIKNIYTKGRIHNTHRDILVLNHSRRVKNGEYFDCVYTSDLADYYKESALVVEVEHDQTHYEPIRESNIIYDDMTFYYIILYALWHKVNRENIRLVEYASKVLLEPIAELNSILGCKVNLDDVVFIIQYKFRSYLAQKKFYSKVLNKITPKVVVEVCYNSCRCMVVNELAKQKGIPVIELQHGSIDNCHEAYNFAIGEKVTQFPDFFFCFTEFWKQLDIRMPIANDKKITVGYPYLEKMRMKYATNKSRIENNVVLFLSNGAIGERVADIACELHTYFPQYKIIYKLHPGEYANWQQRYPQLVNREIEVIDNNEVELYSLFSRADSIVSCMGSTTIFEALVFNKPIFVYNCDLPEATLLLKEKGYIDVFDNADELSAKLAREYNQNMHNDFWPMNSLETMISTIEKIKNGQEHILNAEK